MLRVLKPPDALRPIWPFLLPGRILGTFFGHPGSVNSVEENGQPKGKSLVVKSGISSFIHCASVYLALSCINQIPQIGLTLGHIKYMGTFLIYFLHSSDSENMALLTGDSNSSTTHIVELWRVYCGKHLKVTDVIVMILYAICVLTFVPLNITSQYYMTKRLASFLAKFNPSIPSVDESKETISFMMR